MNFYLLQNSGFDWKQLLLGDQNWEFLFETVFRSFIMFTVIVFSLRLLGKRGVKQLSIFELVVIIGLGSAAGDPMFYKDVGLLPAFIVFTMVISLYRFITYMIGKSKKFEHMIEGRPVCLISEGKFSIDNFEKEPLAQDEFFGELRIQGVMHLGQIELGIIETTGDISLFFYPDEDVKYGLPILPALYNQKMKKIANEQYYACSFCGYTEKLLPVNKHACPICKRDEWVEATNKKRIT
ncbi:MAG TPA: YetF domain-containing protein [Chitinophagaceae bacterium]|nr:YetF domain-containing protein [Chitinophagaceae bacterium]